MNIKHTISNNTFIFENVFDDISIFDTILSECKKRELSGDFVARTELFNRTNSTQFGIQKTYKELSLAEKFIFDNTEFIKNEHLKVDRKDCDINLDESLTSILNKRLKDALKEIYSSDLHDGIWAEYDSVIKYGPGYKMNKHTDAGPIRRTCTAVLYCNTMLPEYEGGETIFYDDFDNTTEVFRYRPNINELVLFDSSFNSDTIHHSVTEIKNWQRYVYRVYFNV